MIDEDYLSKIKALTSNGEIITDNVRFRFHSVNGCYKPYYTYSFIKFLNG